MPKILVTTAIVINFGDHRGGVHQEPGDLAEVSKDVARRLVPHRALYADKKDDPSRGHILTASADMLKAAERMRRARTAPATKAGKKDADPDGGQTDPADAAINAGSGEGDGSGSVVGAGDNKA